MQNILRNNVNIFIIVFVFSFISLAIRLNTLDMVDSGMWGNQALYFLNDSPLQYDFLRAYGHPGGTIIEGTILMNKLLGSRPDTAVLAFITLFTSVLIGFAAVLCQKLKKSNFWWIGMTLTLSWSFLYESATPPSAVASVLAVVLMLLSFYIYENDLRGSKHWIWWGITSGTMIATRADIGFLTSLIFLILIIRRENFKLLPKLLISLILSFLLVDPFMWRIPIQHLKDMFYKIFFHYAEFQIGHLTASTVLAVSALTLISLVLALVYILVSKRLQEVVPKKITGFLMLMTGIVYCIFFTSHIQAIRYLMPVVIMWEGLLSLFVLTLIDSTWFERKSLYKSLFLVGLFICYLSFFVQSVIIYGSYGLI